MDSLNKIKKDNKSMQNEIDILIQALEANLKIFYKCRNELTHKEQNDILYPIILQLKSLCETCISVYQPKN